MASIESQLYQRSVNQLRAQGCRCPLHYDSAQKIAVPHTPGDAARCPVHSKALVDIPPAGTPATDPREE